MGQVTHLTLSPSVYVWSFYLYKSQLDYHTNHFPYIYCNLYVILILMSYVINNYKLGLIQTCAIVIFVIIISQ